jgi:hypothetical protein
MGFEWYNKKLIINKIASVLEQNQYALSNK